MTAFYDAVLAELGLVRVTELQRIGPAGIIWRRPDSPWPQFVINKPRDGAPATTVNGSQVSFLAPSRGAVGAAWKTALSVHTGGE